MGLYHEWGATASTFLTSASRIVFLSLSTTSNENDFAPVPFSITSPLCAGASVVFSVSYDGQTPVETTINISDLELPAGADTWQPNHVYNYFITVSQSGADIEVVATPWDEVSITTDPVTFEG